MAPSTLTINCLLFTGNANPERHVFNVIIDKNTSVIDLRKLIKIEAPLDFAHTDAHHLELWKVSIVVDRQLGTALEDIFEDDTRLLDLPTKRVLNLFDTDSFDPEHLHILIRAPDAPIAATHLQDVAFNAKGLGIKQTHYIETSLKGPAPSTAATSTKFREIQNKREECILNGRPADRQGLPIELYHPVFDQFRAAANDVTTTITCGEYKSIAQLCNAAAVIYESEAAREEQLYAFLKEILGDDLPLTKQVTSKRSSADQVLTLKLGTDIGYKAFLANFEVKNEIGSGGSDPVVQACFSFRNNLIEFSRILLNTSSCPCFLIAVAGPHIKIFGAIFVDYVVVQPLTDWIELRIDPANDGEMERIARVLLALRVSLRSLAAYYQNLRLCRGPITNDSRFFPHTCSYPGPDNTLVNFQYIEKLAPSDSTKPVFKAKAGKNYLVVKFVQRYGTAAHRLLAGHKLAPNLLYSGIEKKNNQHGSCGSLKMVVMEFVNGTTAYGRPLSRLQFEEIQKAVKILHGQDFVFGDLRLPNIMLDGDKVRLIDFDWCEKEGVGKYPTSLNDDGEAIEWHEDVGRNAVMKKQHDDFMLEGLRPT